MTTAKPLIGIIGGGLIGSGLAALFTGNGYPAIIFLRNEKSISKTHSTYFNMLDELASSGCLTQNQVKICASYLRFTCHYSGLEQAEILFECVAENVSAKHQVYKQIEACCPNAKMLASTTSSFSAGLLCEKMNILKDRFLIAHPINPPHLVQLVELIGGPSTSFSLVEDAATLLRKVGRKPVYVQRDVAGLIVNRLQYALFREAIELLQAGVATAEDIDMALTHSFMPRYTSIGLFEHIDNAGLDLLQSASNSLYPTLSNAAECQQWIKEHVEKNELGCKTQKGIYPWTDESIAEMRKRAAKPYLSSFNWNIPEQEYACSDPMTN